MIHQNFPVRILMDGPPYWWEKRFGLGNISMHSYLLLTSWRNLGWKHAAPELSARRTRDIYFILVSKNPYSWLLSLHKRPYHNWNASALPFSDFLRTPWPLMSCDNLNKKTIMPVELWNEKNKAYLDLSRSVSHSMLCGYEEILEDPAAFIREVSVFINLPIANEIKLQNKASKSLDETKSYSHYKDYYLNELWREKLSSDDIIFINKYVDPELMKTFGYSLI